MAAVEMKYVTTPNSTKGDLYIELASPMIMLKTSIVGTIVDAAEFGETIIEP